MTLRLGHAVVALFILCGSAMSQQPKIPPKMAEARAELQKAFDVAKSASDGAAKEATEVYAKKLAELLQEETKAGNLDAAVVIREELNTLKADGVMSKKVTTKAELAKALVGSRWDWGDAPITLAANGVLRQPNWDAAKQVTRWEVVDRRTVVLIVAEANRKTDRLCILTFNEALDEFSGFGFNGGKITSRKRMPAEKK